MKRGAPSVLDGEGQTPLHLAAASGNLELVDALIQAGCDVTVQDFVSFIDMNIFYCSVSFSLKLKKHNDEYLLFQFWLPFIWYKTQYSKTFA